MRSGVAVLRDFNLFVPKGSLTVIFGGSASGKSTICDLIAGQIVPEAGQVLIDGKSDSVSQEQIGIISPVLSILDDRTLYDNIRLPLELNGVSKQRSTVAMTAVLQRFGLEEIQNELPQNVSGSVCQRVAIARAVVSEPFVLIADEPTLHLDANASREIADALMKERVRGMTVLVLTGNSEFRDLFTNAIQVTL